MSFDSELSSSRMTEDDDDVTIEDYQENDRLELEDLESARLNEHAAAIRQYVAAAEADTRETEVNSDEERDILLNIRQEITRQVREEMASELAKYRGENLPGPLSPNGTAEGDTNDEFLEGVDPKLKEAILRMRKLDKILLRKMKKEREVKRDRLRTEHQLREELKQMEEGATADGSKVAKDIRNNTLKFLALKPPPKHNAGVFNEDDSDLPPVFQTEYLGGSTKNRTDSNQDGSNSNSSRQSNSKLGGKSAEQSSQQAGRGKPDKDFIKRNIELAGNASEVVAMTEDERVRLETLLSDLDAIPTSFENTAEESTSSNPFQMSVRPGDGYRMDVETRSRMDCIDARLRSLLPDDDYESLVTPSLRSESAMTQPSILHLHEDFLDLERLGENALKEVKEARDLKTRLEAIDSGLDVLVEENKEEIESPFLDDSQLSSLLSQCARSLSRASGSELVSTTRSTAESEPCSEARSELDDLLSNPPHLPQDVLQQLLVEAREAGIGRHLPALQAIDEERSDVEEDGHEHLLVNGYPSDEDTDDTLVTSGSVNSSWAQMPLSSDRVTTPTITSRPSSTRRTSRSRDSPSLLPPAIPQTRSTPLPDLPSSASRSERLVLPDIELFSQLTAPKRVDK